MSSLTRRQHATTWYVNPDDSFGSTFLLTADGLSSGLHAETTFTDAGTGTWSINNVSVGEGGTATFTITFNRTPNGTGSVSVFWSTVGGTATTADNDYVTASGTVSFSGNTTPQTQTISVPVNSDTKFEPDETFQVQLSSPSDGTSITAAGQGLMPIVNDDPQPQIRINDVSQNEVNLGSTAFTFTVGLSSTSYQTVTVEYFTPG
jgi:hypothetical protein